MSIGSISFWQQDQNYWSQAQTESSSSSASDSLIESMASLQTTKVKGLASIANQEALTRTNNALTAALKSAIATTTGSSSTSSASTPPTPVAATGTGTVPLTANTSLITLGIPATGSVTVSDGTNTTTFSSNGANTVGDLIAAINTAGPKNAAVNAYLNSSGDLVVTAQNNTDTVSVGGLFASNIGFGPNNDSFDPTTPSSSTASTSGSSTSSSSSSAATASTGTSASSWTTATPPVLFDSSPELQTSSATATLLQSGIASGSVLNLFV